MTGQTLRRALAVFCTALMIVAGAAGTSVAETADSYEASLPAENATSPVVVDVMLLRPLGLVALAGGTALFVPVAAMTAITRPHEIAKPFNTLIVGPARYVWADGLGKH